MIVTRQRTITKNLSGNLLKRFLIRPKMTFKEASQDFLYYSQFGRPTPVSKQTLDSYVRSLRQINKVIGEIALERLNSEDIQELRKVLIDRGCSMGYIQKLLSLVRAMLVYVNEEKGISSLPVDKVKLPSKKRREVEYLTIPETKLFLDAINVSLLTGVRLKALVITLLVTGMRISEALSLDRDSIDWTSRSAYVIGKGGKKRRIVFNDWALEWIQKYLDLRQDGHKALFTVHVSNGSGRWTQDHVRRDFRAIGKKIGMTKVTPHALRRTAATVMQRNGANLKAIQSMLGHSSLKVTEVYLGTNDEWVQEEHSKYMKYGFAEAKPENIDVSRRWARSFSSCIGCGTKERRHASKGRCINCLERDKYKQKLAVDNSVNSVKTV